MRVSALAGDMLRSLVIVKPAVSDTKAVYAFAALTAEAGQLRIETTNGDLQIVAELAADVTATGKVLLPATVLIDLAGKLVDEHVSIAVEGSEWATIESGELLARLRCGDLSAWPQTKTVHGEGGQLGSSEAEAVGRILFAASADLSHPILTGVHFSDGHAVATDRYRIARIQTGMSGPGGTVPAVTLREITRRSAEGYRVEFDDTQASFTSGSRSWTLRLIQGDFPDTAKYFSPTADSTLVFQRAELLQAVAATEVAREEGGVIHLQRTGPTSVNVQAQHRELGEIQQKVWASGNFSEEIAFNGKFLREALDAITEEELTMEITSPSQPVVIRSSDLEQVVLPRRPVARHGES